MKAIFHEEATCDGARAGQVDTPGGSFTTPCFMPVGTRGAVRHLSSKDLGDLGAEVVLANTYHLMLRPGVEVVRDLGGLRGFTGWQGLSLTDSGGYQIFSLQPRVDDVGAEFRSTYDGSIHKLTPEGAAGVQADLGADIQMVLDVCSALPATDAIVRQAVDRTSAWAVRGRKAFLDHPDAQQRQCQFGIVQGGTNVALRTESAQRTLEVGFDGYAIGGLSVGETRDEMLDPVSAVTTVLPADQPRYFMGLGDPAGLVEVVGRGVDMFDCVLPTRHARHGTVLTSSGKLNLRNARFATDDDPLDPGFPTSPAAPWSRAYLRHLLMTDEPTGRRLLSLHNLAWLLGFVDRLRSSISEGRFAQFRAETLEVWG
ncbi:MAG TPA: tRNA guanosine(34) transglycosylase Tgt [Acidimicrobiaceae bacterium]|jgi:queuine tRNA-ribosyltransferase|nr:tRNA guanosine(34) transglycosylase Tgt [Acidimicrobiaceae bacterium]HCV36660.1 tRNA guanosine(34) transglycosylase Tgt [Acidimicrobiaceae bacterium]HJO79856.1 tRNA guanosine(34) transglycosylase Tgt [Acidimicrobiales bacterium]|tara:strand:+ start:703 stop:1812 length:1110 start_codon:yes stop_codon:yes gene_type:complete